MTPPPSNRLGPALPAAATAGAGAARLRGAPSRPPRRRSGPAPRGRATTGRTVAAPTPLAVRLGNAAMRVGDARLLDRLVRGRAWIAIIAVLLLGIVFMQVSLLKLNAGISRAVATADTLDRQNSALRADISELDSGERIQGVAAAAGMLMPAAGDVHFLDARRADPARAASSITPPNPVAASATGTTAAATTATGTTAGATTATATTPAATAATATTTATTASAPGPTSTAATGAATSSATAGTPTHAATGAATPAATAPPAQATTTAPVTTVGGATAPQGQG
jgi:cell division protein FtsL